jgi:DNA mismatch endonuclease (patch repair protein)
METALKVHLPDGRFEGTTPQRSRAMQAVRGKDNRTTERRFRLGLVRGAICGWKVRPHGVEGSPDFLFPADNIAIFVDGCFWHGCPQCGHLPRTNESFWSAKISRNRERDKKITRNLEQQGFRVMRFWEHELRTGLGKCIASVRERNIKRRCHSRYVNELGDQRRPMPSYEAGDYVKVEFPDKPIGIGEWMWVRVERCDDEKGLILGRLDNEPLNEYAGKVKRGSQLAVGYSQIREHKKRTGTFVRQ